ncbi:MAG: hypothetical protein VKJ09_13630 [Leptolyngbya sp.]|nr:hypothetical protein [Leptolyngbya sp.]
MDKIKAQAGKVGQLVFAADTGSTYQKALVRTWEILRETALLVWLAICLVFVGGEWLWYTAIGLGSKARTWYEGLSQSNSSEEKSFSEMGQSLLTAGENGAAFLLYQAKKQLGIDAEPPTPKAPPAKPTPSPAPVAAEPPAPKAAPAPPAAAPAADDADEVDDADDE